MALLTLRHGHVADLRTLADITLRRGAAAQRFSGALLVQVPDALRFEALSPFGQPFLLLTVADETLTMYHVGNNRALVGPATSRTTARCLGVALEPPDLIGLLIGRPLPPRELREAEILPADAHGPSLRLVGKDQTQRVWLDPETGVVSRIENRGGRRTLTVAYEQDGETGVPIALRARALDYEASIRYRDSSVSGGIDPALLRFAVPENAGVQRFVDTPWTPC